MEPTTIPHDRFVEAMRDLRQALEMAGTLYLRALGPATQSAFDEAADAFADQECISQESKARCLEDGQSHESCRAALRAEIRGGEVTTPPKSKIQEAHEAEGAMTHEEWKDVVVAIACLGLATLALMFVAGGAR